MKGTTRDVLERKAFNSVVALTVFFSWVSDWPGSPAQREKSYGGLG